MMKCKCAVAVFAALLTSVIGDSIFSLEDEIDDLSSGSNTRRIPGAVSTQLLHPNRGVAVSFPRRTTLVDLLRRLRATTLVELLERSKLVDLLENSGPYTVFAPTDDAFERMSLASQRQLRGNSDLLHQLLLYHMTTGRVISRDIKNEIRIATLLNNRTLAVRLHASKKPSVNFASITVPDAIASNGVVHMISDVLFPIPVGDIVQTLNSCPSFKNFRNLVRIAGLEAELNNTDSPITAFVPTDDAFLVGPQFIRDLVMDEADMESMENTTDIEELISLVRHHLIPGTHFSSSLLDGQELVTVAERELEISVRNNKLREVGVARVLTVDLPATNGVLHAIDRVLRPTDICLPQI